MKTLFLSREDRPSTDGSQVAHGAIGSYFVRKQFKIVLLLIGLVFLFNNPLTAQGDCTDGIHTYKVINGPYKTVTAAISEGLLLPVEQAQTTPQYIKLEEELIVNIDYEFATGSDIIGSINGKISIIGENHLKVTESKVHGCYALMKGFYLEESGNLTITKSNLYNFDKVVFLINGTSQNLTLQENYFQNNLIGVQAQECTNLTTSIYGNTFIGGEINSFYASKVSVAFKIINVDNFIIGDNTKSVNYFKYFNGRKLDYKNEAFIQLNLTSMSGIQNSNIEIINADCLDNSNTGITLESLLSRQDEVFIKNSKFSKTGIYANNINHVTIYDCDFEKPMSNFPYIFDGTNTLDISYNDFLGKMSMNMRLQVWLQKVSILI